MLETLLYSQIPAARHEQVLHILAGVSGSLPIDIREQNLVYQQLKVPEAAPAPPKRPGGQPLPARSQHPRYQRLVRDSQNAKAPIWRLRSEELPEAGVTNVISRAASDTPVADEALQGFRPGSERYRFVKQFLVSGTRFIHGNIVIRVFRLSVPFELASQDPLEAPGEQQLGDLKLLDPSGAYLIEACVRVEDGAPSKIRDQATQELLAFSGHLEGAIDFRVPDRLVLDTRVKAG